MVKYILVLVMLFRMLFRNLLFVACSIIFLLIAVNSEAIASDFQIVNRVVAYVDNIAITLEDFNKEALKLKEKFPDIKNEDVVNLLINRTLLLKNAKEFFVEGREEEIINSYVDLKVKSLIIIPETKIREYYEQNKDKLKGHEYKAIRNDIEKYLFEKELNTKLKEHIEELKQTAQIRIVFIP